MVRAVGGVSSCVVRAMGGVSSLIGTWFTMISEHVGELLFAVESGNLRVDGDQESRAAAKPPTSSGGEAPTSASCVSAALYPAVDETDALSMFLRLFPRP